MTDQDVSAVNSDIVRSGSLNFKVDLEFKRSFKTCAANRGLTMFDLPKEGFAFYQATSRE